MPIGHRVQFFDEAKFPHTTQPDITTRPSPRLIKTHQPFPTIPKGTCKESRCKYIYVARNPFDAHDPFIILRAKWRLWRTIQGHLSSLQTCSSRVKVSHLEIQFYWLLLRMINLVVSLCIVFGVYKAEPNNEMRSQVCGQQCGLQRARFKIERNSRK